MKKCRWWVCVTFHTTIIMATSPIIQNVMLPIHEIVLVVAGVFAFFACLTSTWLIRMHQKHMTRIAIQPKIVGILWMVIDFIFSIISPLL